MSIDVRNLSFAYGPRKVLTDVTFAASEGRLLSVLGPNGVGKSTLFRCILGLLEGYTGEISVDGASTRHLPPRALAKRVAYIPQSSYPAFQYSVYDMVLMGTSARGGPFSPPGRAQEAAASEALEHLGIADLATRNFSHLSGGERQLVLIARALAQQARTLLMDEPTANLDYGNQIRVLTRIRALAEEGYTIVQSTHNPEQSYLFSHEILALHGGRLIAHGPPKEVLTDALIEQLYGIAVQIEPLLGDKMRVCVPRAILESEEFK